MVVPTLLTGHAQIAEQIGRLGVHYLANADGELRFALLSDWTDASEERTPDDDGLLAAARAGIAELNRRHGPAGDDEPRFYLFHRRRRWSESEGRWMGWERKRGKLHELNRLLRRATDTTFMLRGGRARPGLGPLRDHARRRHAAAAGRGRAARRHAGAPAEPPSHRAARGPRGRGIRDPSAPDHADVALGSGDARSSAQVFSGPAGVDPYAAAVSDVYQDLFGEGSYTGKGIYDVDAFERALAGRVPESALLSHDLFEGLFARAGLVTDIELFEDFPSRYEVAARRQHRWARGDWQLLPWLIRGTAGDGASRARIPPIGRWKILDNLRRTLSAPAAYLTLVLGWTLPSGGSLVWTKLVLLCLALPALVPVSTEIIPQRPNFSKRAYLRGLARSVALAAAQFAFSVTLLAHQAWLMADAVGRTLLRLTVTRRRMLEWIAAAQVQSDSSLELARVYSGMKGGLALAGAAAVVAALSGYHAVVIAIPFVFLWASPPPSRG